MGIVKILVIFFATSLILFLITFFSPTFHDVNKENLSSILKTFEYKEGDNDFKDFNNILDTIPVQVAITYKEKIITSNINRTSQDKRIADGEKELTRLTKNVQNGDLALNYQTENESLKYIPYLVVLLGGLFSALIAFWFDAKAKKEDDMLGYLKNEVQRLELLNQNLETREKEFSKKIEKNIPNNLDEAQKILKTILKEKEVMLSTIEDNKILEDKLSKNLERYKAQLSDTDTKLKDVQSELAKVNRQDKLIEELKARHEKQKTEVKEYKQKIVELEKIDVEKFELEIESLKAKINESEEKYKDLKVQNKESKDKLQELNKVDIDSLAKENKELKEKVDIMEDEAKEYQEMMNNSSVGELVREKQEKEEIKKELKQIKSQLESALSNLDNSEAGKIKKYSMELEEINRNINLELKDLRRSLEKSQSSESMKLDMIRSQLLEKTKESDDLKEKLNNLTSSSNKDEQFETISIDSPVVENYLTQIRHLENDLEKLKNDSERFKLERDDKAKIFEDLNEAFKKTNFIIHQKDQEMSIMQEKIKDLESKLNVSR